MTPIGKCGYAPCQRNRSDPERPLRVEFRRWRHPQKKTLAGRRQAGSIDWVLRKLGQIPSAEVVVREPRLQRAGSRLQFLGVRRCILARRARPWRRPGRWNGGLGDGSRSFRAPAQQSPTNVIACNPATTQSACCLMSRYDAATAPAPGMKPSRSLLSRSACSGGRRSPRRYGLLPVQVTVVCWGR